MMSERPLAFSLAGDTLVGVLHGAPARRGVLIVVGGPQYRVGSHRQFVHLARALAAAGIPAMRFDYRGMGDSDGEFRGFENVGADIAAAVDAFTTAMPGLDEVVLWGLCDAASAILFYAHGDRRVTGVVLVNPWVRTETGAARAYLKHYYAARLAEPEFWRKVAAGRFRPAAAARSLAGLTRTALMRRRDPDDGAETTACESLPERMAEGLGRFSGPTLVVLSGRDLTAREFEDTAAASPRWRALLAEPRVTLRRLAEADHTLSHHDWADRVAQWTREWVAGL